MDPGGKRWPRGAAVGFFVALWGTALGLAFVLLFSVYPAYILRGDYSDTFIRARQLADRLARHVSADKRAYVDALQLNGTTVATSPAHKPPPVVWQPLMSLVEPDEVSEKLYFRKLTHPVVYHTMMTPDPFTTYAPLAGDLGGLVFHNKQQFRYPVDLERKKDGEIRIFVTGGSTAWGAMASDTSSTIAGSLERKLRAKYPDHEFRVITAAAGAWSTTQERIWIFNRITEYEPDMIVSYSGHNDVLDVCLRREDLFSRYWFDGAYYFNAIAGYERYNRGEAVEALVRSGPQSAFSESDCPRKTLKNLRIVNSYLRAIDVPFVFVLQPIRDLNEDKSVAGPFAVMSREIAALAGRDGFRFIDHSHLLDGKAELFYDRCHVGDVANDIIASDLVHRIDWEAVIRRRLRG